MATEAVPEAAGSYFDWALEIGGNAFTTTCDYAGWAFTAIGDGLCATWDFLFDGGAFILEELGKLFDENPGAGWLIGGTVVLVGLTAACIYAVSAFTRKTESTPEGNNEGENVNNKDNKNSNLADVSNEGSDTNNDNKNNNS